MSARPPGVVSGEPNITPIFSRSWLMKIAVVSNRDSDPASLRMAWDIRRACRPTWVSPISPSISARGTNAATESITTRSSAAERTSMSAISRACSPESGCDTRSSSMFTPELARVRGVERVLGVDERGDATLRLRLGDHVQAHGRLARALRTEHLDDPPLRDATDAERDVQRQRAGGDDGDPRPHRVLAELHHGASCRTASRSAAA